MTNNYNHIAVRRTSLGQRIWCKTIQERGVKWSLTWLSIVIFAGIFAPFLANSMPLLMSKNGVIYVPILSYLAYEDVLLLASTVLLTLITTLLRLTFGQRIWLFLCGMAVLAIITALLHNQAKLIDYGKFHTPQYTQVEWRIMPLIPYAHDDRSMVSLGCSTLPQPPTFAHPLGTLVDCEDVASNVIHGARVAISVGLLATGIALVIGVAIGGLMGYFGGIANMSGMRLVEIFETMPTLFLMLAFVAFYGPSLYILMVIIGLTNWPDFARYVRAEFLKLRRIDYVQAAIAGGLPLNSILFRHMLPNAVAPLLVTVSFSMASAILAEVTLSYLGLTGVDIPSWGAMINKAVAYTSIGAWWLFVFPGVAFFLTVFSYSLIGEALRDAIDPKLANNIGGGKA